MPRLSENRQRYNISVDKDVLDAYRRYCTEHGIIQSFVLEACMRSFLEKKLELFIDYDGETKLREKKG